MASITYTLPSDVSLEKTLLASSVFNFDHLSHIIQSLVATDFAFPPHLLIFLTLKEFYDQRMKFNLNDLLTHLHQKSYVDAFQVGSEFFNEGLSDDFVKEKVEELKKISFQRSLLQTLIHGVSEFGSGKERSLEEGADFIRKAQEVVCQFGSKKGKELSEILEQYAGQPPHSLLRHIQILQERHLKGDGIEIGYPSHLIDLDAIFDGFKEGHLSIIGARPGVGKTSLMCNLVLSLALKNKLPILIFSLEMPETEIAEKMVFAEASLPLKKVKLGQIGGIDFQKVNVAYHTLLSSDIIIDDTAGLSISLLESRGEYWKMQKGIKIIFIDYLQLLTGGKKFPNKYEEVTFISQRLKVIAKKLDVCVVALAQLNRDATKGNTEPKMHDLRDSGQIEQDADEIFLLHNPSQDDPYNKPNILQVNLVKNRFGKTGKVELFFNKELGTIGNVSKMEKPSDAWDKRFP